MLYAIQNSEVSAVKIGKSANPSKRLEDLQIGSPVALSLRHSLADGDSLESVLHRVLSDRTIHREWFRLSSREMNLIFADAATDRPRATVIDALDDGSKARFRGKDSLTDAYLSSLKMSDEQFAAILNDAQKEPTPEPTIPVIDTQFRNIIESAAESAGSVNRLCKAAGVPQASVSAWLAGSQANLSWSVVARLCDHLGVTLEAKNRRTKR